MDEVIAYTDTVHTCDRPRPRRKMPLAQTFIYGKCGGSYIRIQYWRRDPYLAITVYQSDVYLLD
jgi:hypothetical protein